MADGQQYAEGDYAADGNYEYTDGNYAEDSYAQDGDAQMTDVGNGAEESSEATNNKVPDSGSGDGMKDKDTTDEERKIFIGGISWETEQSDLKDYFSKFGEIVDVNIKTDPTTRKSRGFGFVTFSSQEAVEQVLKNGPHSIKGKQVDPKRAKARPGIKKIFVGGLEPDLPEADIKAYFEKFGKVETVELPYDKMKNQRRQFCFITFASEDAVDEVCKQSKQKIGNKECDIKKAAPKPDARGGGRGGFGGGFGGRGGRGGGGYGGQSWGSGGGGGYGGGYGQGGYGGYNQGGYNNYGSGYGGYDYSGYGSGYNSGYGGYDYSGWNYGQGQQQSGGGGYGKSRRGNSGGGQGYHPYSR